MEIHQIKMGDALTVALDGRLDTMTAPELEAALKTRLDDVDELTFDFANLEYISSAGLRVLLSAYKKMEPRGGLKILHANEVIREIFEVTGFADFLPIE